LSVLPRYTDSDYTFGIFSPLYCLSFLGIRILITPLVSFSHCIACYSSIYRFWLHLWYLLAIILLVLPRYTDSGYTFGIFLPLYWWPFLDIRMLVAPLVSFGHCIACPSSIYGFWLHLWYLLVIILLVLPRYTDSDYPFWYLQPFFAHFSTDVLCIRRLALHQYQLYHLARFCLLYNTFFFRVLTNTNCGCET
jgi:hypothetical protein